MKTKQEYLLSIPFEYIIAFGRGTKLIRNNSYYTKKDYVRHLLRNLNLEECRTLNIFYEEEISYENSIDWYLKKNPTGYHISGSFVYYLKQVDFNIGKLFFEFPIYKTRVDILRIQNLSYSYEIKSERDRLDRLNYQIPYLKQIFEKVYLIFSINDKQKVRNIIDNDIGLITYQIKNEEMSFEYIREPEESFSHNSTSQLNLLRKNELINLYEHKLNIKITNYDKNLIIGGIIDNLDEFQINDYFKNIIMEREQQNNRSSMIINGYKK